MMHPVLRNILAVLAGVLVGGVFNMLLIEFSALVIAPPEGTDLSTAEGLIKAMPLMEPRHFIMPWLAHALGTFLAAFIASKLAVSHYRRISIGIAIWFMLGGLMMVRMLPSPVWFTITDLALAYLPMGWLGGRLARGKSF